MVAIAAFLAFAGAASAAADTPVDTFSTPQGPVSNSSSSIAIAAEAIGGERDIQMARMSGANPVTAQVGSNALTVTAGNGTLGEALLMWDGPDGSIALDTAGLAGADLTAGGATEIKIVVASATAGSVLVLEVFSSSAASSLVSVVLPAIASSTDVHLAFSDFITRLGAGADFASVGAITLVVRPPTAGAVSIETIDAIAGAPAVAATKTSTLATDTGSDGFPSPGDTLGYTVTVTNPGASVTGAELADTLDTNVALVAGSVTISPVALNDFFTTVAVAAPGVLANDIGTTRTIQTPGVPRPTSQGGSATLNADGSFTYTPSGSGSGTADTFTYTISDGTYSDTAVVTVIPPDTAAPSVVSTVPADLATGVAENATITVDFNESVSATTSSFTISCVDAAANAVTIPYTLSSSPSTTFTLTPTLNGTTNDHLRVGDNCTVTVVAAQIHDTDLSDPPDIMAADYVFSFKVPPTAATDTFTPAVLPNVIIDSAGTSFSVTTNDTLGTAVLSTGTISTEQAGTVVLSADGRFTYNPAAGYVGPDAFTYTLTSAGGNVDGLVNLVVAGNVIWFVNNNGGACAVSCNGRLTNPITSLQTLNTVNDGASGHPNDNQSIFVYESGTTYSLSPGLSLRTGQKLIGQDATDSLASLAVVTVPSGSALPGMNSGAPATTIAGSSVSPILIGTNSTRNSQNNALYGFTIGSSSAAGIAGNTFGTLLVKGVTINNNNTALSLTTGSFGNAFGITGSAFTSITSTGGSQNISFNTVGGTVNLGGASGALSGATGPGAFRITNGTVSATYAGTITSTTNPVLITGMTGGGATFSGQITGTGLGSSLTTNTGAVFAFTGGINLSTGANPALGDGR